MYIKLTCVALPDRYKKKLKKDKRPSMVLFLNMSINNFTKNRKTKWTIFSLFKCPFEHVFRDMWLISHKTVDPFTIEFEYVKGVFSV